MCGEGQFALPRLVALCDVACGRLHTPTCLVEGCPREGPGLRVRAERREIMLCYVMLLAWGVWGGVTGGAIVRRWAVWDGGRGGCGGGLGLVGRE